MKTIPPLPRQFWDHLQGLTRGINALLDIVEKERLGLLSGDFNAIASYARIKEERVKAIQHGESQLLETIRRILDRLNGQTDEMDHIDQFKKVLTFKDCMKFERWLNDYRLKKEELLCRNRRNLSWARAGLEQALELSRILFNMPKGPNSRDMALVYDQNGKIAEVI